MINNTHAPENTSNNFFENLGQRVFPYKKQKIVLDTQLRLSCNEN